MGADNSAPITHSVDHQNYCSTNASSRILAEQAVGEVLVSAQVAKQETDIETAWVQPPKQIGGLDHLAVQAPCINIYGHLLPGITNVTDRARYFSFYPWLIWALDQRDFTKFNDEYIERFRRADCLYSLIAERHAISAGGDYTDHAGAMVGSNTLQPVARDLVSGASIRLSDYSLREGAQARYFKNKLGGLGQYYLGSLTDHEILKGHVSSGIVCSDEYGEPIAKSFSLGVDEDLFFDIVERDEVTIAELDQLCALCPCQLSQNQQEHQALINLFFAREQFYDPEALPRRRSLQAILHLADLLNATGDDLTEYTFRACVYGGSLPNGKHWDLPESLAGNRLRWRVYTKNELLSVATQGLFFALLDAYQESGVRMHGNAELVDWYMSQPEVSSALSPLGAELPFASQMKNSSEWLPNLEAWSLEDHEVQMAEQVIKLCDGEHSPDVRSKIVRASVRILIALAARDQSDEDPYREFAFDPSYFANYPINLSAFQCNIEKVWSDMALDDLLRWLFLHWGIEVHLRVALRKLRGQSQSTFRIRPSDQGLEVISVPQAVHTRPRFGQAVRILRDIAALEKHDDGYLKPTALGLEMLELGDAP